MLLYCFFKFSQLFYYQFVYAFFSYHQKYRLQQHSFLMSSIQLKPNTESIVKSHIAARLNGYVVGFGGIKQLEEESEKLGLTGKILDYVRNLVVRYEGQGMMC